MPKPNNPIFPKVEGISEEFYPQLLELGRIRSFNKNQYVFMEGDPYMGFFIIISGRFRIFKGNDQGLEATLSIQEKGNIIAGVLFFQI